MEAVPRCTQVGRSRREEDPHRDRRRQHPAITLPPTDSFGPEPRAAHGGLGFLPGSHAPHYDSEAKARPDYQGLVASGALPDGWACDDGAAIRWDGTDPAEFVASRPAARVHRVRRTPAGVTEEIVAARLLAPVPA